MIVKLVSLLVGFIAGTILTYLVTSTFGQPHRDPSPKAQSSTNAAKLGAIVMAKVGSRFVHAEGSDADGYVFYDQPKPYGEILCRTNQYSVARKVVSQEEIHSNAFWEDNLRIRMLFGVWRAPFSAPTPALSREAACEKYEDFDHLIDEATPQSVEFGVRKLDELGTMARKGAVDFSVTCSDRRGGTSKPCDGIALLRAISVKKIGYVRNISEEKKESEKLSRRVDEVAMAYASSGAQRPELVVIRIGTSSGDGKRDYGWHIESAAVVHTMY